MDPVPLDHEPPPYPEEGDGRVVRVTLRLDVDTQGRVVRIDPREVDPPDARGGFVSAAVEHARQLRFEPGQIAGERIRHQIDHVVVFDPAANEPPPVEPDPDAEAATEPPPQPESTPEPEPEDEGSREVRVKTDPRVRREAVTGGDFDIEPGQLAKVPNRSAEDFLRLAPGMFMVNEGGKGHPAGFFLRGFDAGNGQDIEFLLDGVPLNEVSNPHNHGFADTLFIIPETVQRLRVTEGPFDARQGDFAVAGTVDYELGMRERGVVAKGEYGSFNTGRALLMWGPRDFGSGTFAAVDVESGDGFGINRSYRAARAIAGFEHSLPKNFHLQLLATGYATRFDQAGVIRQDDFEARRIGGCGTSEDAQFFCTYDRNQGGALSRFGTMARIIHHQQRRTFQQNLWVTRRHMRMRANFTGFTNDIRTDGGEQRGDGVEQRYEVVTAGARGSYLMRTDWRLREQELELGYGIRYDDGETIQRRLRFFGGQPYTTDFDDELRIFDISLYAASRLQPLDRLDVNLGLRMDTFAFSTVDRNLPDSDRDGERETSQASDAYGIAVQPRVSTVVELWRWPRAGGPWSKARTKPRPGFGALEWLSAYGVGSRSSDATALSQGEFAPFARVQSAETGLRVRWNGIADIFGFEARSIVFYTHVDRDLVFDPIAGRNELVGESNRFGALGWIRTQVSDWMDLQTSLTWAEAYLPPPTAGPFDWTAGPRLPYVPRLVSRTDVTVFHDFWIRRQPFDWSLSSGVSYVAPRPLPLDVFGTRYAVVDLGGRLRWRWIELGVEIQNLLDQRYHQFELFYASNFEGPAARPSMLPALHFVAGPPLTAMGILTLYFEPDARQRLRDRRLQRGLDPEPAR